MFSSPQRGTSTSINLVNHLFQVRLCRCAGCLSDSIPFRFTSIESTSFRGWRNWINGHSCWHGRQVSACHGTPTTPASPSLPIPVAALKWRLGPQQSRADGGPPGGAPLPLRGRGAVRCGVRTAGLAGRHRGEQPPAAIPRWGPKGDPFPPRDCPLPAPIEAWPRRFVSQQHGVWVKVLVEGQCAADPLLGLGLAMRNAVPGALWEMRNCLRTKPPIPHPPK